MVRGMASRQVAMRRAGIEAEEVDEEGESGTDEVAEHCEWDEREGWTGGSRKMASIGGVHPARVR